MRFINNATLMGGNPADFFMMMNSSQLPISDDTRQEPLVLPLHVPGSYEPGNDQTPFEAEHVVPVEESFALPYPEVTIYRPALNLYDNVAFQRLLAKYGEERILRAIQPEYAGYNDEDETEEYQPYGLLHDPGLWEDAENDERMALVQGFYTIRYSDPDILNAFEA